MAATVSSGTTAPPRRTWQSTCRVIPVSYTHLDVYKRQGPIELDTVSHEARVDGQRITLTPTEFRLLRFLIANPGRVYSRQQLLDNVWGDHVYIEDRTVDIHIRRLRVALGPAAEQMVETVRGAGYKLSNRAGANQMAP